VLEVPLVIEPDPQEGGCATVWVEGTAAGRRRRFLLDTGAARTQLVADDTTADLPVTGTDSSHGVFGPVSHPLVTVPDLAIGPLRPGPLQVTRAGGGEGAGQHNLLGMDVLRGYACHFRFGAALLLLGASPDTRAGLGLHLGERGHCYVTVTWPASSGPAVTAHACWDSGAGITVAGQAFAGRHPGLFAPAGQTEGTDSSGTHASTPLAQMAGPVIGGARFAPHVAAVADLSAVNATLSDPMDLILGYPTLAQADWLFDIPARRWAVTRPPDGGRLAHS
jgi:aspartyl protease